MPATPSAAMTANHSSITGPNALAICAVPRLWMANSPNRIATAIETTCGLNTSVATLSPSRALNTEIAGVMMPSP